MTRHLAIVATALALLLVTPASHAGQATPLREGQSVSLRGTTVAERPELAGGVIQDKLIDFEIHNAAGDLIFKGRLQDRVVRSRVSGALSFSLFIRDTQPDLPGVITTVTRDNFANVSTDVEYRVDGMGHIGPKQSERDADGGEITFRFEEGRLHAGNDSRFFFILTDATKYAPELGTTILWTADGSSVRLVTSAPRSQAGGATLLGKGQTVSLGGTTVAERPELAGGVIQDKLIDFEIHNAAGDLIFKGRLQDRVVRSKISGALSFSFFIRDTRPDLPGVITTVTRGNFANVSTDVEYRVDGVGHIGPKQSERDADGGEITFRFEAGRLHAGNDSRFFFILTDATEYAPELGTTILGTADGSSVRLVTSAPRP
jgi:hypothetical protein